MDLDNCKIAIAIDKLPLTIKIVLLDPNRCDSDCNSALFLGKTYFAHEYKILQVFISTV